MKKNPLSASCIHGSFILESCKYFIRKFIKAFSLTSFVKQKDKYIYKQQCSHLHLDKHYKQSLSSSGSQNS